MLHTRRKATAIAQIQWTANGGGLISFEVESPPTYHGEFFELLEDIEMMRAPNRNFTSWGASIISFITIYGDVHILGGDKDAGRYLQEKFYDSTVCLPIEDPLKLGI